SIPLTTTRYFFAIRGSLPPGYRPRHHFASWAIRSESLSYQFNRLLGASKRKRIRWTGLGDGYACTVDLTKNGCPDNCNPNVLPRESPSRYRLSPSVVEWFNHRNPRSGPISIPYTAGAKRIVQAACARTNPACQTEQAFNPKCNEPRSC